VFHTDIHLLARVALACALAFAFGFERQLRGSPAGNRTFVLIGGTAAAVTSVAGTTSPQAIAGILTGIGFIGAGVVFVHGATIRGLTSAATVFAVAGIGIVLGYGHLFLGLFVAAVFLFMLELQHIPGLRSFDASTYAARFANDYEVPLRRPNAAGADVAADDPPGTPAPGTPARGTPARGTPARGTPARGSADDVAPAPPGDPAAPAGPASPAGPAAP
jgi:putative Mg2+ transporter-C (MgtC) family protein